MLHEKVVVDRMISTFPHWYYDLISFVLEHNAPRLAFDSIGEDLIENVIDSDIDCIENAPDMVDENTESCILDAATGNHVVLKNTSTPTSSRPLSADSTSEKRKGSTSNEDAFLKKASSVMKDISNTINTKNKIIKKSEVICRIYNI